MHNVNDSIDLGEAIAQQLHAEDRIPAGGLAVEVDYVVVARVRRINGDGSCDATYETFRSCQVEPDAQLGMAHRLLAESNHRMGI